ncbi:MAG: GNAT family N-acetyltransferase [Rhizobiales bacterium]|nr:GNAT family N-acetyltransferase [Hyphomicrobiales bacterium]
MKVRAIRRGDASAIATMMEEFDRHFAAMEGRRRRILKRSAARADLERAGFGRRGFVTGLIAEDAEDACGYLLYHFGFNANVRRGTLVISDLFVRAKWRRHKVGLALMRHARRIALERGCARMDWTVWNMNPPAIAFYLSFGAKPVDDEIVMGLNIAR